MDEVAKAIGMSRNEMILKAIGMMISFDKVFYKKLEAYGEKMKVPMWTALQNMTIKR
jgi:phosphoheptose isomerase